MKRAIQYAETFDTWEASYGAMLALGRLEGCLGVRVRPVSEWAVRHGRGRVVRRWALQALFREAAEGSHLPDGCRHVVVPPGLAAELGIRS